MGAMLGFFSFNKLVISYHLPWASAPQSVLQPPTLSRQNTPDPQEERSALLCPLHCGTDLKWLPSLKQAEGWVLFPRQILFFSGPISQGSGIHTCFSLLSPGGLCFGWWVVRNLDPSVEFILLLVLDLR